MSTSQLPPVVEFAMQKFNNLGCVAEIYTTQILWASEYLAEKTGYTQEEILKLGPRELLEIDSGQFLKYIVSTFSNSLTKQKLIKKDGTKINGVAKIHSFMYEKDPYVAITDIVLEE
jgi:hypothetical protein